MYYVYVIANELNNTYVGYTSNLEERLKKHKISGSTKGHDWHYVYYEAYKDKKDAVLREQRLKDHGQSIRQLKNRIKHSLQK